MSTQHIEAWLQDGLAYVEHWLAFQMRMAELPGCAVAVEPGKK